MAFSQYLNNVFVKISLISLVTVAVLFYVHHSSYKNSLRYTMIAEGNISVAIGEIWLNGLSAFKSIVINNEAEDTGRIRPAHWLLYQIPFLITLVRNGDIVANEDGFDIVHRINGDLQTHTVVLLMFVSIAVVMMSYVLLNICESWFACLLFIVIFSGSLTISQNLLRNYCDSGEIFQLFLISLYVFTVFIVWRSSGFRRHFFEILSVISLFLAYTIKETVLTTLPIAIVSLGLLYMRNKKNSRGRVMLLRQLGWHILFSLILLFSIYSFKNKGYSTNYSVVGVDYYSRVQTAIDFLRLGFDTGYLILLSAFALIIAICLLTQNYFLGEKAVFPLKNSHKFWDNIFFTSIAFGGCVAFIAINIPWQLMISKYFIAPYFFLSLGLASLQSFFLKIFHYFSLKLVSQSFVCIVVLFSAHEIMIASAEVNDFYESEYGIIDSIPVVTNDIVSDARKLGKIKARIINNPFHDGGIAFSRYINLVNGVNIEQNGKVVSSISAPERNYFHIRKNAPSAELVIFERLGESLSQDIDSIYIWNKFYDEEAKRLLATHGFEEASILEVGSQDIVRKFCRLKKMFFENSIVLLSFDEIKDTQENLKMNDIEMIVDKKDLLTLQAIGDDPYFLLPEVNEIGWKWGILRLVLNSTQKTVISLYHRTVTDQTFSESRRYSRSINAGENELYFFLPFEHFHGSLRIDLGDMTGIYLLRDIEVRAISTRVKSIP
ncbi:MAG: hypothetical protein V2B20_02685 [Pseudomonadota bacterium]